VHVRVLSAKLDHLAWLIDAVQKFIFADAEYGSNGGKNSTDLASLCYCSDVFPKEGIHCIFAVIEVSHPKIE
jgi:hypothetical protein